MLNVVSVKSIQEIILPLTEFRKNMSNIIEELRSVKVLMKNDKPKAVLVPYDIFVEMEEEIEAYRDLKQSIEAEKRLKDDSEYLTSDQLREMIAAEDEDEVYG